MSHDPVPHSSRIDPKVPEIRRLTIEVNPFASTPTFEGRVTFIAGNASLCQTLSDAQAREVLALVQPMFAEYIERLTRVLVGEAGK